MPPGTKETESWSSCPIEIFEQIVVHLDGPSLLNLGKVDHLMNQVALKQLFEQSGVQGVQRGWIFAYSPNDLPKEIVPALCIAFWISDHIHDMRFYMNPDVNQSFREIRGLARFIEKLKYFGGLTIVFNGVDRWISRRARFTAFPITIPNNIWRAAFCSLLKAALLKKCEYVEIQGAHSLHHHFETDVAGYNEPLIRLDNQPAKEWLEEEGTYEKEPEPSTLIQSSGMTEVLTRWLKRGSSNGHSRQLFGTTKLVTPHASPPSLPPMGEPCLKQLLIRSPVPLLPLFLPTTLRILNIHAPTITELALVDLQIDEEIYIQRITQLKFPGLRKFSYVYDISTKNAKPSLRTPECILAFLQLNPSINTLHLYGFSPAVVLPYISTPLLPRLKSLKAHPRVAAWILCDPDWHAVLEALSLVSDKLEPRMPVELMPALEAGSHYQHFDEALLSVAALSRPVTLELIFRSGQGLLPWITEHVNSRAQSAITQLTHVTSLTLSLQRHIRLQSGLLSGLPKWIGLFPVLQHFELLEVPYGQDTVKNEKLYSAITRSCPRLETLRVCEMQVFPGI